MSKLPLFWISTVGFWRISVDKLSTARKNILVGGSYCTVRDIIGRCGVGPEYKTTNHRVADQERVSRLHGLRIIANDMR